MGATEEQVRQAETDAAWAKGASETALSRLTEHRQQLELYPHATDEPIPKEKTLDDVSMLIRHLQQTRGKTDTQFDDALFTLWRRLMGLDPKVMHESDEPERPLTWDDGRRVVLYAFLVIGELHALATGERTG